MIESLTLLREIQRGSIWWSDQGPEDDWLPLVEDLIELVRWLALPYGDNAPVFATELPDGRPLQTGQKLSELYRQVVGEKRPTPGAWVQCSECRAWYVRHPDSDRHLNGHDVAEMAKQIRESL